MKTTSAERRAGRSAPNDRMSGNESLRLRLTDQQWLHQTVGWLRIYPLTSTVLHRIPVRRQLHHTGLRYRISSLDQLGIQAEIFGEECYSAALDGIPKPQTIIDLGSNAGWFEIWLAYRMNSRRFQALLIDADNRLVREARWHMEVNRLSGCSVVHGAAGAPPGSRTAAFFIYPSASQSSLQDYNAGPTRLPVKGATREIRVPAVSVEEEWTRQFGNRGVDILKVDIEGAERGFLESEAEFIARRVRRVVIEWHKWSIDSAELDAAFLTIGFIRTKTISEDSGTGVALFDRL
jgi:FkbM family methyltransferase